MCHIDSHLISVAVKDGQCALLRGCARNQAERFVLDQIDECAWLLQLLPGLLPR